MGIIRSPFYDVSEKKLTVSGSRKEGNTKLYGKIRGWAQDIRTKTGVDMDDPAVFEYNMYAWLYARKGYTPAQMQTLAKRSDKDLEALFKEYHDTLVSKKRELPDFLDEVGKEAAEKAGALKFPGENIETQDDAARLYSQMFWMTKMLGTRGDLKETNSSLYIMDTLLKPCTDHETDIALQACNFDYFKNTFNKSFAGKTIKNAANNNLAVKTEIDMKKSIFSQGAGRDPKVLKMAEQILKEGKTFKQFEPSYAEKFNEARAELLGRDKFSEILNVKSRVRGHVEGLNTGHRYWFTGTDSNEMDKLKKACAALDETKPYGENDRSFPIRYTEALYNCLDKALTYKVAKDDDGKTEAQRTRMGSERYKANDRLIETLLAEIKRVDAIVKPVYAREGILNDYPKVNFDASRLIGAKVITEQTKAEADVKASFLKDTFDANKTKVGNKKIDTIEDLEKALNADRIFKKYSTADLPDEPIFNAYAKDPSADNVPGKIQEAKLKAAGNNNLINGIDEKEVEKTGTEQKERNELESIIVNRQTEEEKAREFKPQPKSQEQKKKDFINAREADMKVKKNLELLQKKQTENEIRKRVDNHLAGLGKTRKEIGEKEYKKLWDMHSKKYKAEQMQKANGLKNYKAKLEAAKEQSIKNRAAELQKKLDENPLDVLFDEMDHEITVRKTNLSDKKNFVNSCYKSLMYQVFYDEYAKTLGVDPALRNKQGIYNPADVRAKLKTVPDILKDTANSNLRNALKYGPEENKNNIDAIKNSIFGQKFTDMIEQEVDFVFDPANTKKNKTGFANQTGIMKIRDRALKESMEEIKEFHGSDSKELNSLEKLSRSLGSCVTLDELGRDFSNNKSPEIKTKNFQGVTK